MLIVGWSSGAHTIPMRSTTFIDYQMHPHNHWSARSWKAKEEEIQESATILKRFEQALKLSSTQIANGTQPTNTNSNTSKSKCFFCNGRWQERMKRVWMKLSRTKKGFVASAIHCIECQQWYSCLPTSSKSEISGRSWEILTLYKIDQNISEGENLQCDHWFIVRHILLKKAMNEWEPCKIGPDCCQWHRSPELGVNLIWRFTLWLLWSTHMEQLSWE